MIDDGVFCEYTELFRTDHEASASDLVRRAPLEVLDLPDGPVVDIGAGTGLGTIALAAAFPDREILAVEPNRVARTVLLTRLGEHYLTDRVTVYADDVETADLPTCAGALGIHLLCQLTDGGIPGFLRRLDFLLADDGAMLIDDCFGPSALEASEMPKRLEHAVGRRTYQRWSGAEVTDDERLRISHVFKTVESGQVVREEASVSEFVPTSRERVHEMFAEAGFVGEPVGESFLVLQRA